MWPQFLCATRRTRDGDEKKHILQKGDHKTQLLYLLTTLFTTPYLSGEVWRPILAVKVEEFGENGERASAIQAFIGSLGSHQQRRFTLCFTITNIPTSQPTS